MTAWTPDTPFFVARGPLSHLWRIHAGQSETENYAGNAARQRNLRVKSGSRRKLRKIIFLLTAAEGRKIGYRERPQAAV